ncbi:Putative thiol oxidoreductase with 2 cytochrome c heme-binding site [Minicystis rosea]|nr:Putative thiol oxidoreductase with 2 cytochrome c heme-binding site [Minicystis rosea]
MKARAILAAIAGGLLLWACAVDESRRPVGRSSPAEAQNVFSTSLPDDYRAQATAALEADAFRREHRFLDAVDPGHLFRATRVEQAEIEAGAWTNEELFQIGGQLFNLVLTRDVGFGARDLPPIARFHTGRRGGPDASRCAACHWRGGPAGGGDGADSAYLDGDGNSLSSALARNPIALPGEGFVELLATEMNAELSAQKNALVEKAAAKGAAVTAKLTAKGISFGALTARPDGSLVTSALEGVDADLVVKPFGWKGNVATIRDAVEDALLIHHGMESDYLVSTASKERIGPFGGVDPDGDGITSEITEGQVTALTLFVAMQELPQIAVPDASNMALAWADGRTRFASLGCASCHVPSLPLEGTTFTLPSRTGGASVTVDLAKDAAEPRIVASKEDGSLRVSLFSDLKRHDLGAALAEPRADRGVAGTSFLTRPLWGVSRSGPYLHDGRAPTLEDAILAHGGEAQKAREAYEALADPERGTVRLFLTSLTRAKRLVVQ